MLNARIYETALKYTQTANDKMPRNKLEQFRPHSFCLIQTGLNKTSLHIYYRNKSLKFLK